MSKIIIKTKHNINSSIITYNTNSIKIDNFKEWFYMYYNYFNNRNGKSKHKIYRFTPYQSQDAPSSQPSLNQNEETGFLSVGVFTALQALPVKGAEVIVYDILYDGTEFIHSRLITDDEGRVPDIELPIHHSHIEPSGSKRYYFTTYNLRVTADNYYPFNVIGFRIFPGMKTNYTIDLLPIIPGETTYTPEQTVIIPPSPIDGSNF